MIKPNWTVGFTFDFHIPLQNGFLPPSWFLLPPQKPLIGAYFLYTVEGVEGGGTILKVFKMAEK